MAIDYKKELESAAKSMILVHEPDVLIKLVVRLVVQKVKVKHAGILLHQKENNTYLLSVSRGPLGLKIPPGFARMDMDNPLIKLLKEHRDKSILTNGALVYEDAKRALARNKTMSFSLQELLEKVLYQLEIFDVSVCIPSYFREELLGVMLLGSKSNGRGFGNDELDFFSALTSDVAMAIRNARLFKELENELHKRRDLYINTTIALAAAIEAKDHYTHGHTERVTFLSLEIAKEMRKDYANINDKFLEDLRIAALLHDIGKIGVPEHILNKEGPLTQDEWTTMKTHPTIGATILQPIIELDYAIMGVKYHHERYDGKGYPEGLSNGTIPINASIIAVADSFDAMTTDRPYRKAKSTHEAIQEITRLAGEQFHPKVAAAFAGLYAQGKL